MEWFSGGVANAIAACRQQQALFIVYIHGEGQHQKSHKCVNPHTEILLYQFSSIWVYFTSITTNSWIHEAVVLGYMLWHEITDKRGNYPGIMLVWVYEPGWRENRSVENRRIYFLFTEYKY